MSKLKATEGPWSFRYYMEPAGKNGDNFHLIDGPDSDQGGTILEGAFTFPGSHSEALKVARLIAAAPDLYEALSSAVDSLEKVAAHLSPANALALQRGLDPYRAALARARGEQP